MENEMLRVDHVTKEYRLGMIGGTTLKEELQSRMARMRHQEDPNQKIGAKVGSRNEKFLALNDVSFSVKKGEAVGIIGHNGAGKSTLLKLITRITAPTSGEIGLNGRIASMLEVGTGFHPELTGRENVYMNGAILGMTKAEIDKKMEDIIEFSEVRQFIDTPVKRYSSGMYVKLAFSVAAHLDSEIMIMDEVLAVGDMAFQKKCLDKMRNAAKEEGRTVLYVSHNMNTIRQLCDRCIVLNKGKILFQGEVEEAIQIYLGENTNSENFNFDDERDRNDITGKVILKKAEFIDNDSKFIFGSKINIKLTFNCKENMQDLYFRFCIYLRNMEPIATSVSQRVNVHKGINYGSFQIDLSQLAPEKYIIKIIAIELSDMGTQVRHDCINRAIGFEVYSKNQLHNFVWDTKWWGHYVVPDAKLLQCE